MKFTTYWRVVHDPEEIHQFVAFGGGLVCPAVLAGCGPSRKREGEFWWNVKQTPVSSKIETQYCGALWAAKARVESSLQPYLHRMSQNNSMSDA